MLGAIIGDIIVSRWEFCPTNDYHFEWISAQNDYTDDTLCTVAVADAIVHQSDDYGSYIHHWCRSHLGHSGSNEAASMASPSRRDEGGAKGIPSSPAFVETSKDADK